MKCGCKDGHDRHGRETIALCAVHAKEHSELHERAMVDYRKTNPVYKAKEPASSWDKPKSEAEYEIDRAYWINL